MRSDRQAIEENAHLTFEGLVFVSLFSNFALVGGPFADLDLGSSLEYETDDPTPPR
jgi:hypothetical protein